MRCGRAIITPFLLVALVACGGQDATLVPPITFPQTVAQVNGVRLIWAVIVQNAGRGELAARVECAVPGDLQSVKIGTRYLRLSKPIAGPQTTDGSWSPAHCAAPGDLIGTVSDTLPLLLHEGESVAVSLDVSGAQGSLRTETVYTMGKDGALRRGAAVRR